MNDASDLISLMAAMLMFSVLTVNISKSVIQNGKELVETEVEYSGIALAQNFIDEARWLSKYELTPGHSDYKFTDYQKSDPKKVDITIESDGKQVVAYQVYVAVRDTTIPGSNAVNKKVEVGVSSPYFYSENDSTDSKYHIKLSYIKSFL